ncbi:glycosyltransferase, partial [Cutibacterium acnes]
VLDDAGKRLGPGRNFLGLTKFASADYAVFCDQDDIWFEKKLEALVAFADREFEREIPSLVYCDGYAYSSELGVIARGSISRIHAQDLCGFLFLNAGYQGCSMLFNRPLYTLAANYRADYYYMHDDVVSLLAHTFGKVNFLPKQLMFYRQHDANVTAHISSGWRNFLKRCVDRGRPVISSKHYEEKASFYRAYAQDLSPEARRLFEA